jgi:hypothetical protein
VVIGSDPHRLNMNRTVRNAVGVVALALAVLTGCGGGGPTTTERPLTSDEAAVLASTLYLNHRRGIARFEAVTLASVGGSEFSLSGELDWGQGAGWADVIVPQAASSLTRVYWSRSFMIERRPALDALLVGRGIAQPVFIARPADFRRRVDGVIRVISSLAVEQPENAVLIRQQPGSAFLRYDNLRGREVAVMRYGTRSVYWMDRATGALLRFEGSDAGGRLPLVVDVYEVRQVMIDLPDATQVVDIAQIPEIVPLMVDL